MELLDSFIYPKWQILTGFYSSFSSLGFKMNDGCFNGIYKNKYVEQFVNGFFNGFEAKEYKGRMYYKDEFIQMLNTAYGVVETDTFFSSEIAITTRALKMVFDFYAIDDARTDKRLKRIRP